MTSSADSDGLDRREVLVGSALLSAVATPAGAALRSGGTYDVVIVGGGSAGSVLANRLSADPARRILLIEAGRSYAPGDYPAALRLQSIIGGDAEHDWGYRSEPIRGGGSLELPRAKVLGGCSAINAGAALRAPAADFERWTRMGIKGWTPADVLPFYRRSERTRARDDHWHGRSGPWPVHQLCDDELSDMQRAFLASCEAAGLERATDLNGPDFDGASPYPMNVRAGTRLNAGMTYLASDVRARANLTILPEALVDKVGIEHGRAVCVLLADGRQIAGGEIILSAGAYGSPMILLRSGVGPVAELRALGIQPLVDLPVGQGLKEHPFYMMAFAARPERLGLPYPPVGAALIARSRRAQGIDRDLHVSAVHYGAPADSPTGAIFKLAIAAVRTDSRGSVTLRDRDPRSPPRIQLGLLAEQVDRDRLVDGVELVRRIAAEPPLRDMIAFELTPGQATSDRASIERALPAATTRFNHPCSTVRMGADGDPLAVLDGAGRVRGVAGLRVIDASIFPDSPSTTIHATVIMAAEKIADGMIRG